MTSACRDSHLDEALAELDPAVRAALEEAIVRVRTASHAQVPPPVVTELGPGARVAQRWQPVARVGLYVPGGKAVYPSSVVMNVVPAQVAGVERIALASPPQRSHGGRVHPVILAAARLLGVDEVYAMGGAGAIGAFAAGVASLGLGSGGRRDGPRQQLRRGGQARRRGTRGDGCRGRRDRDPRRRGCLGRPAADRGRPREPGRARRAGRGRARDRLGRARAGGRSGDSRSGRGDAPRRARRDRARGSAVGDRARRRSRGGDGLQQRVRARAPRAAPRATRVPRTSCTRGRSSSDRIRP